MRNIKDKLCLEKQLDILLSVAIIILVATKSFHGILMIFTILHVCLNINPIKCNSKSMMKGELLFHEKLVLAGNYAEIGGAALAAISGLALDVLHQTAVYILVTSLVYNMVLNLSYVKTVCFEMWYWIVDRKEGLLKITAVLTVVAILIAGVQNSVQEKEAVHMNNGWDAYEYSENNSNQEYKG